MADRISRIQSMLAKSPNDVFLTYSLGMELCAAGRLDESAAAFGRCIELDGQYLPAYVEAGKCLRSAGRLEDAKSMFTRALEVAKAKGDSHSQDFILQQLESLPR